MVSVLGLFVELLLIRWISTEIRIFAYLQNTVLIVCFLGLGVGCFTSNKPAKIGNAIRALLILTCLLAIPFTRTMLSNITEQLGVLSDLVIWYESGFMSTFEKTVSVCSGLVLTMGLMILLWEIFVPVGRMLGKLMNRHPNTIAAYSINIAGSMAGIGLFVLLSAFYLSPVVWFIVAAVLFVILLGFRPKHYTNLGLVGAVVVAAMVANYDSQSIETVWSPYQKLTLSTEQHPTLEGKYLINVNNCGYQGIIDLSDDAVAASTRIEAERKGYSQYDLPLMFQPDPGNVLIVGAGSGNDVSGALRNGARSVTAVEIDPAIIEMGRKYHPEQPYQSDKVTVVNDDARSFFASTDKKFDLIIFGLLDSHTTNSMNNARLDHYVYTRQSIERAKSLLTDNGVICLSFEARKTFISDRIARCIHEVFGWEPIVFRVPQDASGWGGVMFLTGNKGVIEQSFAQNAKLEGLVEQWQSECPIELTGQTPVATDDWPYLYLESARVPVLYLFLPAAMLCLLGYGKWRIRTPIIVGKWNASHWHFFFLGAAFLLLEVQNISKAAVVLGNTWLVNAVIIGGILTMILIANLIEIKWPQKLPTSYAWTLLIGTCLALFFIDISSFAFLPYLAKSVIVGTLTTLPMLFSGIIFIRSFTEVKRKNEALGANLIGSIVGGVLQSITFVIGIKALLLVVAMLYLAARFSNMLGDGIALPSGRRSWFSKAVAN
ncbi:spermine/spermidine synthase domain-containing protein [Mariniblastus fucicola]|uniref:spermine/spermidine synthase domain-containing protein n=1 Tax=Mariniblastus fucicola TaxID=980251 RepID=UPI0012F88BD5|nr:methyltransferase domain-containing protein [Mariniblastus fucicola]